MDCMRLPFSCTKRDHKTVIDGQNLPSSDQNRRGSLSLQDGFRERGATPTCTPALKPQEDTLLISNPPKILNEPKREIAAVPYTKWSTLEKQHESEVMLPATASLECLAALLSLHGKTSQINPSLHNVSEQVSKSADSQNDWARKGCINQHEDELSDFFRQFNDDLQHHLNSTISCYPHNELPQESLGDVLPLGQAYWATENLWSDTSSLEHDSQDLIASPLTNGYSLSDSMSCPLMSPSAQSAKKGAEPSLRRIRIKRPEGMVGMALYCPAALGYTLDMTSSKLNDAEVQVDSHFNIESIEGCNSLQTTGDEQSLLLPPGTANSPEDYRLALLKQHRDLLSTLLQAAALASSRETRPNIGTQEDNLTTLDCSMTESQYLECKASEESKNTCLSAPMCDFDKQRREVFVTWTEDQEFRYQKFSCKKLGKEEAFRRAQQLMLQLTYFSLQMRFPSAFRLDLPLVGPSEQHRASRNNTKNRCTLLSKAPDEILYEYYGPFKPTLTYRKCAREWVVEWVVHGRKRTARWSCKKLGKPEAVARAEKFVHLLEEGEADPQIRRSSKQASFTNSKVINNLQTEKKKKGGIDSSGAPKDVSGEAAAIYSGEGDCCADAYQEDALTRAPANPNDSNDVLKNLSTDQNIENSMIETHPPPWEFWIARPSISERQDSSIACHPLLKKQDPPESHRRDEGTLAKPRRTDDITLYIPLETKKRRREGQET